MKAICFGKRNAKEVLRDPINIIFGLGFEIVLLILLSVINKNIPKGANDLFSIDKLAPAVAVFGLSFSTLFSATLISKDRGSSLLSRLLTTPMSASDFIFGYTLPMIPFAMAQTVICYLAAFAFGLTPSVNLVYSVLLMLPVDIFFISCGLLFGSIFNEKQVGGICGALLTNLSAWLSGTWFDVALVGGAFAKIASALPYMHAVDMQRAIVAGRFSEIFPHIWWVIAYAVAITILAIAVFTKKMKHD